MATSADKQLQDIIAQIELKILTNVLKPKQRLIERELMEEYCISRGTVRKILKELAFHNLIKHNTNKGATVADPSPKEINDIYNARCLLESHAIDSLISNIDETRLAKIKSTAQGFEDALKKHDLVGIFTYNRLFHGAIFGACDNGVIIEFIDQLRRRSYIWYSYFSRNNEHRRVSVAEHDLMIECLEKRDAEGLKKINHEHLKRGYEAYSNDLQAF